MRSKGKITTWNEARGYGFISPNSGGKQVFVHISAFANRNRRPAIGQVVSYGLSTDKQGRPCAVKATLAGDRLQSASNRKTNVSIVVAISFTVILVVSVAAGKLPPVVLVMYAVFSIITFITYAADKSAAKKGNSRTPEKTLHLLALAGGWPGAVLAQYKLRHKSSKQSFRTVFWLTTMLNCGLFIGLFSDPGSRLLEALMQSLA